MCPLRGRRAEGGLLRRGLTSGQHGAWAIARLNTSRVKPQNEKRRVTEIRSHAFLNGTCLTACVPRQFPRSIHPLGFESTDHRFRDCWVLQS